MKREFDIKFRPQIESGEYKVVTGDNRPVRIISWDKKAYGGRTEIVAFVPTLQGDTETVQLYSSNGALIAASHNEKFKLFIITPEPELTEFEKALENFYNHHLQVCTYDNQGTVEDSLHNGASKLLSIAKRELCKDCTANMDGYAKGRLDALYEMARVYKHEGPTIPAYWPICPNGGGQCTNPMRDCINCSLYSTNVCTNTGTSMAKVEVKK